VPPAHLSPLSVEQTSAAGKLKKKTKKKTDGRQQLDELHPHTTPVPKPRGYAAPIQPPFPFAHTSPPPSSPLTPPSSARDRSLSPKNRNQSMPSVISPRDSPGYSPRYQENRAIGGNRDTVVMMGSRPPVPTDRKVGGLKGGNGPIQNDTWQRYVIKLLIRI